MSERSDQVQKVLAVLARHADIVAEAFEGAVSGGDRQHQKGVDALFEIGAIKPYDEDTYRLNPRLREFLSDHLSSCRIPDDCIDSKRYPLFMARAVLKELIESLQSTQGVKPC